MDWGELSVYIEWMFGIWLGLIMGLIVIRMLSGTIILTGLFQPDKEAPFGLDRLQLVFVTLLFAAGYLVASFRQAPGEGLPEIPTTLLMILIGSNGTYLAVKFAALKGRPDK